MAEILSQEEIDRLLEELSDKNNSNIKADSNTNIKKYDFRSPKRISRDQIKVLNNIYENFARHFASYLSGILSAYCDITVQTIDELPYYEYNNALPDTMITGVYSVSPIEGYMLMDLSNNITFALLEKLLGGSLSNEIAVKNEFTEIDRSILERILKRTASFIDDSWSSFDSVHAELHQLETNTRLIQSMGMDEVVIIVNMNITIKSIINGSITCCIPCLNLENILEKQRHHNIYKIRDIDSELNVKIRNQLMTGINNSNLELKGILGETTLSLNEVSNLQTGDVIKLDQNKNSKIKIIVNDEVWFYAQPGIKYNKKALKINKVLQERDISQ